MALLIGNSIVANATPAKAGVMTLERYIGQTLENSPDAARIMKEISGLKADSIEAGQKINPDLKIDVPVKRNSNNNEIELEFEQPLRPSDFGARHRHADAIRSTLNDEQKARLLDLSHEAVRAYVVLWTVQEQVALLDRLVRDAGRQTKMVQDAAAQGLADKAETEILTTEAAEMKLQKSTLEAKQKILLASFIRLAGLPYDEVRLDPPVLPVLPSTPSRLLAQAGSETAIRALLRGRLAVADQRLAVARADASLPEFAPRAVFRHDLTDDSNAGLLGVRVTLPVWSRNEAETLRARAAYDEADRALKALDANDLPSVLAAAWKAAVDTQTITEKYKNTIVPGWLNVQKLTEHKMVLGQASVFDLWQTRSRVLEAETKSLESRKEAVEAVLSLESLSGQSFLIPLLSSPRGDKP